MPLAIKDIHRKLAAAQPLTDIAFASAFVAMQRAAEPVTLDGLRGLAPEADEGAPAAFAWAEEAGLLPDFVEEILNRAISIAFREVAAEAGVAITGTELQSIVDPADPWLDPVFLGEKLARLAGEICTIMIDGEERGTGFLVRPNVLATACHVIEPLLERDGAELRAQDGSVDRLEFVFDNVIAEVGGVKKRRPVKRFAPDPDWLLSISEYHPSERRNGLPDDLAQLKGMFDFALIRLATIVGIGLEGLPIDKVVKLGAQETQITILHHPGRKALKYGRGKAEKAEGEGFRVWHAVNTEKGSSGAPCLNDDLSVVGMHQAGRENGPGGTGSGAAANRNRTVPIHWSLPEIDGIPTADPGLMPLARLPGSGRPVFGRSAVNGWVFRNVTGAHAEPILAVEATDAPGKSFTGEILRALLPPERHNVVVLATSALEPLTTRDAVALLWESLELPKAAMPGFDRLSTPSAHLKNVVVEAFVTALATPPEAERRTAWVVLDDYRPANLDPGEGGTRDLMNLLLLRAGAASHLHFALLGYEDPHEIPEVRRRMLREALNRPTQAEMETFLRMNGLTTRDPKVLGMVFGALNFTVANIPFDHGFYATLAATLGVDG